MILLLAVFACGPAAPPPLPLDAPWTSFGVAASGATVKKSTPTKLVLVYPKDAHPAVTARRYVDQAKADGWTVDDGSGLARGIVMWTAHKEGRELLLSVVPQPDRLEVHLDL